MFFCLNRPQMKHGSPRQHGFDFYQTQIEQQPLRGRMGRERTLFRQGGTVLLRNDQRIGKDDPYHPKHFTDANGDYAVELIEKFAATEKPFYINLWWLVPHKPSMSVQLDGHLVVLEFQFSNLNCRPHVCDSGTDVVLSKRQNHWFFPRPMRNHRGDLVETVDDVSR